MARKFTTCDPAIRFNTKKKIDTINIRAVPMGIVLVIADKVDMPVAKRDSRVLIIKKKIIDNFH
jgi:hypothetical protein